MPSTLPDGEPAPDDGALPESVAEGAQQRDFGVYLHVPFCTVRCGYCDFNTYTEADHPGMSLDEFPNSASAELDLASRVIDEAGLPRRSLSTVFFGGGTPTLLSPEQIGQLLEKLSATWGLAPDAEVTVEANPDTLSASVIERLAQVGVTRLSLGVQSFVPHVLRTLDRTHNPESVAPAVRAAREAGVHVSMDLIYATPGESMADWRTSVEQAIGLDPDHLSAYSLIVEPGTALARRVRRGELEPVDEDRQAEFYELADDLLTAAGYHWYEVSNWSRSPAAQSRHNLSYWTSQDWWGVGPGAHSHIGGVRWWNVKHPAAWAARLRDGSSPAHSREILDSSAGHLEQIMLGLRLAEGIDRSLVGGSTAVADEARQRGWVDPDAWEAGRLVLTRAGRLLADGLALRLAGD